jgi:hypothetical protein
VFVRRTVTGVDEPATQEAKRAGVFSPPQKLK